MILQLCVPTLRSKTSGIDPMIKHVKQGWSSVISHCYIKSSSKKNKEALVTYPISLKSEIEQAISLSKNKRRLTKIVRTTKEPRGDSETIGWPNIKDLNMYK